MQQSIDFKIFKENPQLILSKLPKDAEFEIVEFINFLVFKYDINLDSGKQKTKFKYFIENPVKTDDILKISREELHETSMFRI